jgi:hypothetical protein
MVAPAYGYARGYRGTPHLKHQVAWLVEQEVMELNVAIATPQDLTTVSQDLSFDNLLAKLFGSASSLYCYSLLDLGVFSELQKRVVALEQAQCSLFLAEPPLWLNLEKTSFSPSDLTAMGKALELSSKTLAALEHYKAVTYQQRALVRAPVGRAKSLSEEQAKTLVSLRRSGATIPELMKKFSVSKSTVQKYWREGKHQE